MNKKIVESKKIAENKKERPLRSDFPKDAFEEALKVAQAIEDKNSGNSLPPQEVAIALERGPGSSAFRDLLSSSNKYGLTTGSFNTPRIDLTDLARDIVEPKDEKSSKAAAAQSVFRPELFSRVFDYYKGKKVPDSNFFSNTLTRDFGIPKGQSEIFVKIFLKNMQYLGLVQTAATGPWFKSEVGLATIEKNTLVPESEEAKKEELPADEDFVSLLSEQESLPKEITPQKVFISHGNNKDIVNQLKELLIFGKFVPEVAEEKNTTSIPVPDKVLNNMKDCFAGIIHVEGEEQMIDKNEKEQTILNQNVLIEIGAALALYGKNTILLVKKGTQLPSNLQGLYKCEYEGEKLDYDATMRLLKTFNSFS